MISNRKARLLLNVPFYVIGKTRAFRVSNRHVIAKNEAGDVLYGVQMKRSPAKKRAFDRWTATMRRRVEKACFDVMRPYVGQPLAEVRAWSLNLDLSALEERIYGTIAGMPQRERETLSQFYGGMKRPPSEVVALSVGRIIHEEIEADGATSVTPVDDKVIATLLDPDGQPVAELKGRIHD